VQITNNMSNLTLKRIIKRHKDNPQDSKLHQVIEEKKVDKKEFDGIVEEATKQPPFDKK